jgi:mRNA interferase RelE/StbE
MSNQYLLLIDKSVAKQLQKFPAKQYKQIVVKLLSLASNPKPHGHHEQASTTRLTCPQDCKALKGIEGGYSVDSGKYRILYYLIESKNEQRGQVQIFRVGKRNDDEVYRNL